MVVYIGWYTGVYIPRWAYREVYQAIYTPWETRRGIPGYIHPGRLGEVY